MSHEDRRQGTESRVFTSSHYGGADATYETIKVLRAWMTPQEYAGFLKGNAIKYTQRHRAKGREVDIEKALQYTLWLDAYLKEVGHDTVYPPELPGSIDQDTAQVLGDAIGAIQEVIDQLLENPTFLTRKTIAKNLDKVRISLLNLR